MPFACFGSSLSTNLLDNERSDQTWSHGTTSRRRFAGLSARTPAASEARKRKPYKQPTLKKMTVKEAKAALEAEQHPDENTEKMLKAINCRLESK